jgi:hypothetical protein
MAGSCIAGQTPAATISRSALGSPCGAEFIPLYTPLRTPQGGMKSALRGCDACGEQRRTIPSQLGGTERSCPVIGSPHLRPAVVQWERNDD